MAYLDSLIAQLEKDLALAQERLADPTNRRWDLVTITPAHARYVVKTWPKKIASARRNAPILEAVSKVQP